MSPLLATRVILEIGSRFDVEIEFARFFDSPTVAALAEYIETVRWVARGLGSEAPAEDLEVIEF